MSVVLLLLLSNPVFSQDDKLPTLFSKLYEAETKPKITITTAYRRLLNKSNKEEYQDCTLKIESEGFDQPIELMSRIRSRGNMRKQVCIIPPVKIDFMDEDLIALGLDTVDKLKMVFPCRNRTSDQERLYKELMLYDVYEVINPNSIRARLVDIAFIEEGVVKAEYTGFIVEDELEYAHRMNARIVESGKLRADVLDRESFLKMTFFQYMIANVDWSVVNKHNLEMVKLPDVQRVVPLPYDFDYSGIVGHHYAVPHETLPIKTVQERYFFDYKVKEGEFYAMVDFYNSKKDDILRVCDEATYMKPKTQEASKSFLNSFFKLLEKPNRLKSEIVKR